MPERQGRIGDTGLSRLVTLLEALGWTLRGDPKIDIPCTLPSHDRDNDHGVDAYMSYDCPFRAQERGIFIESKSSSWNGINSSEVKDAGRQILQTVECVPEAEEFDELLNFGESRTVNAGVLGIYGNDGYDHEQFTEYVEDIPVEPKRRKPFQILILGNRRLDRLASLHAEFSSLKRQFHENSDSLAFYYPSLPDSVSDRIDTVTMEYMLSDYVYAKLETMEQVDDRTSHPKNVNIVFNFDSDVNKDSLGFMYQSMVQYQLLDAHEVWVYLGGQNEEEGEDLQIQSIQEEFVRNVLPDDSPDFDFRALPRIDYASYTDRLRGE